MALEGSLDKLYQGRFTGSERSSKNELWRILCRDFFQKFIPPDSTVLDVGAGYCEFINNIDCKKKFATDLNPDTSQFANPDVEIIRLPSTDLSIFQKNSLDRVFVSNLLEHLKSKDDVMKTLEEVFRVLKPGGQFLILQPNIRYLYKEYWDFFDHYTPLSDKSLAEALQIVGFSLKKIIPKFLPYTVKSKLPKNLLLVKLYLRFPLAWRILGKQLFALAQKP